jgi:hypothetical protein
MKPKLKTCKAKGCGNKFTPYSSIQTWCSTSCGYAISQAKEASNKKKADKAFKQETVRRKKALKSRSDWLREAQAAFNAFIRQRDAKLPCISCGALKSGKSYIGCGGVHAGHYRSVGANRELRFEELNVNNQCAKCNATLSGNLINYRIGLIKKIGLEKVEWIEGPHEIQKLNIEQIKEIKATYQKKLKELQDNG